MKRINILMALLICAYSLVGCRKEANIGTPNDTIINTTDSPYLSVINYELTSPIPGPGSLVHWNSGYISTTGLIFNATHKVGNLLRRDRYGTAIGQVVTLFHTTMLGSLKVPGLQCDHASFTLRLGSLKSNYALFLSGVYNTNVAPLRIIPVQVIINDPVELNTVWLNDVVINKTSYTAVIEFNLDKITNGITNNMINNAAITNGTIFITSTSNQTLYGIIVNNLQDNNMNVGFWSPLFNITDFTVK